MEARQRVELGELARLGEPERVPDRGAGAARQAPRAPPALPAGSRPPSSARSPPSEPISRPARGATERGARQLRPFADVLEPVAVETSSARRSGWVGMWSSVRDDLVLAETGRMRGAAVARAADRDQRRIDPGQRDRRRRASGRSRRPARATQRARPGRSRHVRPVGRRGLRRLLEALDQLPHAFVGVRRARTATSTATTTQPNPIAMPRAIAVMSAAQSLRPVPESVRVDSLLAGLRGFRHHASSLCYIPRAVRHGPFARADLLCVTTCFPRTKRDTMPTVNQLVRKGRKAKPRRRRRRTSRALRRSAASARASTR